MTTVTQIMQATVGPGARSKRPPMWPISKVIAGAAVAAAAAVVGAGCTASSSDVQPDELRLFFPTGAVISPDGARLFVANANSDLTYSSGSISVIPLTAAAAPPDRMSVEDVIGRWVASRELPAVECDDDGDDDHDPDHPCCKRDEDFSETLTCDEDLFLSAKPSAGFAHVNGGVQIGNFATDIAVQDLGGGKLRLIVPTRGDPSIAWADWDPDGQRLRCDDEHADPFRPCDDAHRLSFVRDLNDRDLVSIPDEPFAVFADTAGEFAMVTHLTSGAVTLIDSPRNGKVRVTDVQAGIFDPDPTNNARGATGIAGRTPRAAGDIVYVGSRSDDRIQMFTVGRPVNEAPPFLLQGSFFFLNGVGNDVNANSFSTDTRGMAFSATGDRLYLVNRRPPSLQIFDTSLGPTGVPNNELAGAVDICRQASTVAVVDSGDGERAYVTCFQDGQVYVVDPRGHGRVEDIITVGRGPYATAAAANGQRLYITNFLEDTVAVIDLTPGSPTRNRVVLRIGEPRAL
jgi:DNA-binding beta-propeller fold protein YncE